MVKCIQMFSYNAIQIQKDQFHDKTSKFHVH